MDITPFRDGDEHFYIKTNVSVSHQFFGWVASPGDRATIVSPPEVKDEFVKMLNSVIENHN